MGGIKKADIKRVLKKLRQVRSWQLFLILIPLLFIEATLLRFDHIKMTELKKAVIAADEEADDEAIAKSLKELKDFTFSHTIINVIEQNGRQIIFFGTGPFYLEHQYQRKAAEAIAAAEAQAGTDENPNGNVFAKAMAVCKPLAIQYAWAWNSQGYLDCMTGEIAKYPTTETLQDTFVASIPSTILFRFNYVSPIWSASLSGLVAVLCVLVIFLIIIRVIVWAVLRLALIFLTK